MPVTSFRHKGLKALFEGNSTRGVDHDLAAKLRRMLAALDRAASLDELETLPGWRLHALRGDLAGRYSLSVSGNWRLIFRFENGNASDIDRVDYH